MNALCGMDCIALLFFFVVILAYAFSLKFQGETYNLIKVMHRYRLQWIKHMIKRNDRTIDLHILTNMSRTATLFAAVSVVAMIALIVLLIQGGNVVSLLNDMPFSLESNFSAWSVKVSLFLGIIIFSFFKFTWVVRQLNYIAVLIVAAPSYREGIDVVHDLKRQTKYVNKIATILSNIDKHFITAIRSIYFSFAILGWFVHPVLFIILTLVVLGVLYRREFMSKTLILLS